jgi:AraC-like DNA-binding protein/ligand-binding sensor protein
MPQIIREVLQDRLWESPPVQEFEKTFRMVTGMPLRFLNAEGTVRETVELGATAPFCAWLQVNSERCEQCTVMRRSLLQRAIADGVATGVCGAGLTESVVALKTGQHILGFFQTGFVRVSASDAPLRQFPAALADVAANPKEQQRLHRLLDASTHVSPEQYAGMVQLLHYSAQHIASRANQILVQEQPKLPPAVARACEYIRVHYRQSLSLATIAHVVRLSPLHLCKTFHKHTGLRFKEYLARVRVSHCKELLVGSDRKMSDIATACGFESLSQFNRSFHAVVGMAPREFRRMRGVVGVEHLRPVSKNKRHANGRASKR